MQEYPNSNEPPYQEFSSPPPPPPPGPIFPTPYPPQYGGPVPYPPYPPQYGGPIPFPPFPPQKLPNRRTAGGTILSIVLYLWGATCAVLGLAGILLAAGNVSDVAITATVIGIGAISIISLILTLILHKHPLRWWIRLLAELGAIIVGFVVLIIGVSLTTSTYATQASSQQENLTIAIIFLIYGLVTMFLALW